MNEWPERPARARASYRCSMRDASDWIRFYLLFLIFCRFYQATPLVLRVNKPLSPFTRSAQHISFFSFFLNNFTNLFLSSFFTFLFSALVSHSILATRACTESAWMKMTANEKRMAEREALRSVIQQWNANRLDLFELSEPDEVNIFIDFDSFLSFYYRRFNYVNRIIPNLYLTISLIRTEPAVPWRYEILFSRSWTKSSNKMYSCGIGRHRFGRNR